MTLAQAMGMLDHKHPGNQLGDEEKIRLLSELDSKVFDDIISTHEGAPEGMFSGYDASTDLNTILLIPDAYARIYLYYLESHLSYQQGEMERYNHSAALYNQGYTEFSNIYNRTNMPVQYGPFNV